jgi:preprotein translocase subunit SecB
MSRKHSFVLTLSNNVTEKEGVNFLIENYTGFFKIDLSTKKQLLDLLNIEHRVFTVF